MKIHTIKDSITEPIKAVVKYSFSFFDVLSDFPFKVLKIIEPPIPINKPKLKIIFQIGATTANAAVPSGP